jgi:hypothetical protein
MPEVDSSTASTELPDDLDSLPGRSSSTEHRPVNLEIEAAHLESRLQPMDHPKPDEAPAQVSGSQRGLRSLIRLELRLKELEAKVAELRQKMTRSTHDPVASCYRLMRVSPAERWSRTPRRPTPPEYTAGHVRGELCDEIVAVIRTHLERR